MSADTAKDSAGEVNMVASKIGWEKIEVQKMLVQSVNGAMCEIKLLQLD